MEFLRLDRCYSGIKNVEAVAVLELFKPLLKVNLNILIEILKEFEGHIPEIVPSRISFRFNMNASNSKTRFY